MAHPIQGTAARRNALRLAHRQTTLIAPSDLYQRWLDRMQVPTPRGKVVVTLSPNPTPGQGEGGQSYPGAGQENILLQPNQITPARPTLEHEMGHAFWRENLTPQQQQRIIALMGSTRKAFDGQPNPPGERFAEIYRVLSQHSGALKSRKAYHQFAANASIGYMSHLPHYFQMRKIARVIDSAG